jgi:hypothetical protein
MEEKASPAQIEHFLKDIDFQARKDDLLKHAKDHQAPENVLSVLSRIPDQDYASPVDVAKGIGQVE